MKTTINNWSCYAINEELYASEQLKFDNAVQRGYVWDRERQSLLIHSLLAGYPIPPVYVNQIQENDDSITYDVLDGKQRLQTIIKYMNDEFSTTELDSFEMFDSTLKTNKIYDISNKKFSELEPKLQQKFKSVQIMVISVFANEDDISEMFYRLNNGKPLSAIEHSRAKAKDLEIIQEIGKHNIFNEALTEKALAKYTQEEIVVKSYIMLYEETPNLASKNVKDKLSEIMFTDIQKEELLYCYDYILKAYDIIKSNTQDIKLSKKVAKRILTRTHLLSLLPLILKSKENNIDVSKFSEFLEYFYSGTKRASINDNYNNNASSGSSKPANIKNRLNELEKEFKLFLE